MPDLAPADDSGGGGSGGGGGGAVGGGAGGGALPFPAGFRGCGFEEGARSEDHCSSSSDKICSRFCLFVRGTLPDVIIFRFGLTPLV